MGAFVHPLGNISCTGLLLVPYLFMLVCVVSITRPPVTHGTCTITDDPEPPLS